MPFRKLVSARIYFLSFIEAAIATACYVAATFIHSAIDAPIYLMYENGAQHIGLVALTFLLASYLFDFYKQIRVRSRLVLVLQLIHLIGIIFMVQAVLEFVNKDLVAPHAVVITGSALTLVVLIAWRLFIRPAIWNAIGAQRVLFVGSSDAVDRLAEAFTTQPTIGIEVAGYVLEPGTASNAAPVLGGYSDLPAIVAEVNPDRVIVGAEDLRNKKVLKTLFDLRAGGVTVESAGDVYEAIFGRIYSRAVEPYTVIFRNELSARPGSVALQSIYTNLLALIAAVITLPVMVLIGFLCDSRGHALSRFLQRFKLDALPEILNVVRGEMTLIGPRAERVEFSRILDDLIPFYRQKYSVKPGILGWSQLHCDTEPTENTLARIEHDLYYMKHISLVLDAYTLIRAVKWMLADSAARQEQAAVRDATA